MSQKVAGMVHAEMNLERGIRASKPRHQSVQKWPSSIFFFLELEQITILGTAKRNQPTKDKGQETKDRTKTGAPTRARSGGLNTKAKGLPPDPTPPHAPPPGRWGGRQRKRSLGGPCDVFFFFFFFRNWSKLQFKEPQKKCMRVGRGGRGCRLSQDGGVLRAMGSSSRSAAGPS